MEVILIERHSRLGDIGSIVKVKDGYARNYLLPTKKAIRAHEDNKRIFEAQRADIQKEFNAKRNAAEVVKGTIDLKTIILVKQAGKDDRLYGSVSSNDIVAAIKEQLSQDLPKSSIKLLTQIKSLGAYTIPVNVFSDVHANVEILIARSKDEAEQELAKRATASESKRKKEEVEIEASESKQKVDATEDNSEAEEDETPTKTKTKGKAVAKTTKAKAKSKAETSKSDSTTKSPVKRTKRV